MSKPGELTSSLPVSPPGFDLFAGLTGSTNENAHSRLSPMWIIRPCRLGYDP